MAVISGDTLQVLDGRQERHTVRVLGIAAPNKGQPFAAQSREHLEAQVLGQRVEVRNLKRDERGNLAGLVYYPPDPMVVTSIDCAGPCPIDAGERQLSAGMGWLDPRTRLDLRFEKYDQYGWAQKRARHERHGLWAETSPVAPWEWQQK